MARSSQTPTGARKRTRGPAKPRKRHMTTEESAALHYTYPDVLAKFITERGKIRSRRVTGLSRRDQSRLANAVKRARELALLPYVDDRKPERPERGERRDRGDRER